MRFADLAEWVHNNRRCDHTVTVVISTMRGPEPTYAQCAYCGQVRRRYGLKPPIHNGKKGRK